jgi:hypothetical protein
VIQPEPDGQVEQERHADPDEGPDPASFSDTLCALPPPTKRISIHNRTSTMLKKPVHIHHSPIFTSPKNDKTHGREAVGSRLEQIHLASRQGLTYSRLTSTARLPGALQDMGAP